MLSGLVTAMFVHLHVRSWFSFLAGGSSPEDLVQQAVSLGQSALALTDVNGVYGAIRFQKACRALGVHPVIGAEVSVEGSPLVLLARSPRGYFNLNQILTRAHADPAVGPGVGLEEVAGLTEDLICLTGGREGKLWQLVRRQQQAQAAAWLAALRRAGFAGLYVELTNGLHAGDRRVMKSLHALAVRVGLPVVATNDVRFARPEHYRRYDLLTCVRLKQKVTDPHGQRPGNAEAFLKGEEEMRRLVPFPEALAAGEQIARACQLDLLPGLITPPAARIPEGFTAQTWLATRCYSSLLRKYGRGNFFGALAQLNKEVGVICHLGLEDFFLVVWEVVHEAQRRGIRCAGRGSAANSIIAYLLDITAVDPLRHRLLFERFLHTGRKGTPDIDVDFDSERRDEVISWMETRFGSQQTAMTATLVTYRLHSAVRDAAKALGWSLFVIDRAIKRLPLGRATEVRSFRQPLEEILGDSPLLTLLLELVEGLEGCPRHLGLHVGGMVLSREHLSSFSPVQISANGVKMVQFDKGDVEALGLVKFDVLGLRMLATLSEAVELMETAGLPAPDLMQLPLEDPEVYRFICTGETLGVFQIESMGQMHLLAQHQPACFEDLISEIALFRPGPLQGGMVHPFIRRRRGEEVVTYDHPDLEEILRDTYGVILFQEQILEIAHRFAGMSLQEADDFRALMSRFRDPGEMASMRGRFVGGAVQRGVPEPTAQQVFDKVANFVGYGFCRSHAAAFAQTVYHSAWLKCFYPAAYMAAVLQHRPGMYSQETLEEEARRQGVPILGPHINSSSSRYSLEALEDGQLGIRKPLSAIDGVSEEVARRIVWCRMHGPFRSTEDLIRRVALPRSVLESMARSGALDCLAGSRRRALWEVGVLEKRLANRVFERQMGLLRLPAMAAEEIPELPDLTGLEEISWDWQTQHASRVHPLALVRRYLKELGVQTIETLYRETSAVPGEKGRLATVSGLVILRQRPPTAKGMMFLTLEDETGFIQCMVHPSTQQAFREPLMQPFLILRGKVQGLRNWRCLVPQEVLVLDRFKEKCLPVLTLQRATGAAAPQPAALPVPARRAAP
ncbi:MAG: DNA polymerase III subunit alpha [Candidatus Latescibacterota bacterium]